MATGRAPRPPRPTRIAAPKAPNPVNFARVIKKAAAGFPTSAPPQITRVSRMPGPPALGNPRQRIPTASELLASTAPRSRGLTRTPQTLLRAGKLPTAEELLAATEPAAMGALNDVDSIVFDDAGLPISDDHIQNYAPTRSSNPNRPRTREASYSRDSETLRIRFRDGGTYDYFGVPNSLWLRFKRVKSPGKFIDANIRGAFDYEKVDF